MSLPKLQVTDIQTAQYAVDQIVNAFNQLGIYWGTGSPETVVTAGPGRDLPPLRRGATHLHLHKESGTGNTGWVAK
jgi:hypothetical protein